MSSRKGGQIMKLLHLYYDLMNLYGEYANMAVLASG